MMRRLVRNSISNVIVLIVRLGITLVMTPVIVKALGNYDYGIWSIVISVIGYMGLLDMGFPSAIVRYVARFHALQERRSLDRTYSSTLFFMGIVGLVIFIFFLVWALFAPEMLAQETSGDTRYGLFLFIIGLQMFVTFLGYVFQSFHEGLQRYDLTNLITTITSVIGCTVVIYLLQNGGGLLTLALGNGIGFATKFLVYWILLRHHQFGRYRFALRNVTAGTVKELFNFGVQSFVIGLSLQISRGTAPLIIGMILGPISVTFFVIPASLIQHANNLITSITMAFMPYFSDLNAHGDLKKTQEVYLKGSKYFAGVILPIFVSFYFLGLPFLSRWMGREYAENGRWVLYILALGYILPDFNPFSNRLLTGIGRQGMLARIRLIGALGSVGLSFILIKAFGNEGIAVATLVPALITEPIILYVTCKEIQISLFQYVEGVLVKIWKPGLIAGAVLYLFAQSINIDSYPEICVIGLIYGVLYIVLFWVMALDKEERDFIMSAIGVSKVSSTERFTKT